MGIRIAVVALVALAVSLVLGWGAVVALPLVAIGGVYAAQLAIDDEPLDDGAAFVAAGLVATFELAYWSLEERDGIRPEPGEALRRLAYVAGAAVAALLVALVALALVDGVRTRGLAVDLVGATAAAGVLAAIAILAARRTGEER